MIARAVVAAGLCASLLAVQLSIAYGQNGLFVEVSDQNETEHEEVEKRMMPHLVWELKNAKSDALLLYTEYTAKAGMDLKNFLNNITQYADDALRAVEKRPAYDDPHNCQGVFEDQMEKIKLDAYKAASYSGVNHHKFILGHMVVFRMHLNKTEDYIRRCERALNGCGVACEEKPQVKRWKRLAMDEIHRVHDDMQHTRRSYRDLVAHAKRRLNHLRKEIYIKTTDVVEDYHKCLRTNRS